jgi:hypothetical protein
VPVDNLAWVFPGQIEVDIVTMDVEQVTPQFHCRFEDPHIKWEAEFFVLFLDQQPGLGVLNGIKDTIQANFHAGFHKMTG